jgi:type IV pilus assembly protein PilQ
MKNTIYILLLCFVSFSFAQNEEQRLLNIKNQLDYISTDTPGLTESVKTEINVNNTKLTIFLLAISEVHNVNFNISPELNDTQIIVRNFTNVTVADLLIFLCKEYQLTIDFTGNIMSIKKLKHKEEVPEERIIPILFNPNSETISIDAQGDLLYELFKRISDESGKNMVYESGLDNRLITFYVKDTPIDAAMDKLAFANDLFVEKTKDGFYRFEDSRMVISQAENSQPAQQANRQRPRRQRSGNFFFKVKDSLQKTLEVDFVNTPIETIITDISNELNLDVFTAKPLREAGLATFKARKISYDDLLIKLFEAHEVSNGSSSNGENTTSRSRRGNETRGNTSIFTFKKEGNIYFFGTENQLSVRTVAIIKLEHRSVRLLSNPSGTNSQNSFSNSRGNNFNTNGSNTQIDNFSNKNRDQVGPRDDLNNTGYSNEIRDLVDILPKELMDNLSVQTDYELNSYYVNGPGASVERFKQFIKKIDKPVPVVLIEVMIIEVSKSATIDAGVSWGIGTEPTTTQGGIYPETDLALGATTVNKIIGSFNDFAGFNLGRVGPNFFASIKASETNGDLKVRSTPKLATLNSHRAVFSNSQTSFYAVTQRNIYGTDNPQTSEITNYYPIDAELSLTITPSVTGSDKVILDIGVIQSSFGNRVSDDAPPDINSRSFSSIIAMQDQDIAILGGIEEQYKSNRGSGVPFLARIPIIKWLFSRRVREGRKSKLTVLIKPTIID